MSGQINRTGHSCTHNQARQSAYEPCPERGNGFTYVPERVAVLRSPRIAHGLDLISAGASSRTNVEECVPPLPAFVRVFTGQIADDPSAIRRYAVDKLAPNLTSDGLKLTNVRPSEVNALSSDGARWGCGPAPAALGAKFQPAPPRTRCCWEHVLSRGRVLRGRGGGDFKSSNCCCECCDCVRSSLAHRIHASAVSCGRRWQNTHDGLPARGGTRA